MQNLTLWKDLPVATETQPKVVQLLIGDDFITKATECVKDAKAVISICAYTWRWYENQPESGIQKFNYELARKVKQGVEVRALLEQDSQAAYLRDFGIKCRTLPTKRVLHTKAICIDQKELVLGSHNLTMQGTRDNYEASVLITDPSTILAFDDYFVMMWGYYAG